MPHGFGACSDGSFRSAPLITVSRSRSYLHTFVAQTRCTNNPSQVSVLLLVRYPGVSFFIALAVRRE